MSTSPHLSSEEEAFRREVETFGDVCQLRPLSVSWSASGSSFWRATLSANGASPGQDCFLKHYAPHLATEAKEEGEMASRYAAELQRLGLDHIRVVCPLYTYTLRDGSVVVVSPYVQGEVLMDLVRAKQPLGEARSEVLRLGLLDLAQAAVKGSIYHRDINLKNLLLAPEGLWLIDFQTAIPKANPRYHNPSFDFIRSNCGLGFGYSPRRGVWNDAFSVLAVFNQTAPLMALAGREAETRSALEAAAQAAPTLHPEYSGDGFWRDEMRKARRRVSWRLVWTLKPKSRVKLKVVREVLSSVLEQPAVPAAEPRVAVPAAGNGRLGEPYGKTVGLAILGFKSPETTRHTIQSHIDHGLYRLFDEVVVCIQNSTPELRAIVDSFGLRHVDREDNLGIQGGFRWIWQTVQTDYLLVLENDFPVCVSADSMEAQLRESMAHLEAGEVDLVRLRNRYNPGAQNRFARMYSRFWEVQACDPRWANTEKLDCAPHWLKILRRLIRPWKAQRWAGRSPYIERHPEQLFPRWIKRLGPDFFCVDSWVLPWTNQSTLLSHELMGHFLDFAEAHPSSHTVNAEDNKLQTLEPPLNRWWWRNHHFRIGLPEGIFTHDRHDR